MNVALYCRVSTTAQDLLPQRIELLEFAQQRGFTVTGEFSDVVSGSKAERAGLDNLIAAARRKEFECVLVVKLDRLGRSLKNTLELVARLEKYGVSVICSSQGIDTRKESPCGRMQLAILGAVAEFERDLIRERTTAGMLAAKARGVQLGHPSKRLVKNWREVVDQWRDEGAIGFRELAEKLGGVSLSTASHYARRDTTPPGQEEVPPA